MKKILYVFLLSLLTFSCTDDFEEYNTDKKQADEVPGETLFTQAQRELADQIASTNVNNNIYKLFAQYWTETTYTDEANYDITNRTIPDNIWRILYRDVLMDLKEADKIISEKEIIGTASEIAEQTVERDNKLAITEILSIYTWQRIVDTYGNVPYSEALDIGNVLPAYDDALTIYKDLLVRLDAAIAKLDNSEGSFGSADVIYSGDVDSWMAFANSLKLKMGLHLADVSAESALVTTTIEAAAAGVISSAAGNAAFVYLSASPNTNPLYIDIIASGRHDFVAANTIMDKMNSLNDPRVSLYFETPVDTSDNDIDDPVWIGGPYGASCPYTAYCHVNSQLVAPTFECLLFSYSEVEFYLAEAAQRGYNVGGTAAGHYDDAVQSSILYWGGTTADAASYLAQASVDYATVVAATSWKEAIATQAWIGFYNRGFIAWTEWRRLDAPVMNIPPNADTDLPVRMTYSNNEQTLNGANYTAAAAAIGGDLVSTKLFWDKN